MAYAPGDIRHRRIGRWSLSLSLIVLSVCRAAGHFLVGPVVGSVDETSARILIETSAQDPNLQVIFSPVNEAKKASLRRTQVSSSSDANIGSKGLSTFTQEVLARHPTIIRLQNLLPGTSYEVMIRSETFGGIVTAHFMTLTPDQTRLKIGFLSCNDFIYLPQNRTKYTWQRLLDVIRSGQDGKPGLDYLIHMGDQVYLDGEGSILDERPSTVSKARADQINRQSMWRRCRDIWEEAGSNPQGWQKRREECVEKFRTVYRVTWSRPEVALVLASVPNLMVADDHDFRDDMGDRDEDSDPTSREYMIGLCALEVYHEYQTQLQRDVDLKNYVFEKVYSSHLLWNRFGIYLWDLRVERSLRKGAGIGAGEDWTNKAYLGPEQHKNFEFALDGQFKEVDQLVIVTPTPIVVTSARLNMFLSDFENDLYGTWEAAKYRHERNHILARIAKWLSERSTRSVVFMAGDIHIGGHSTISIKEGCGANPKMYKVHQLTCSAMACEQRLPAKAVEVVSNSVLGSDSVLWDYKPGFGVAHQGYYYENNFGIVDVTLPPSDSPLRPTVKGKFHVGEYKTIYYNLDMEIQSLPGDTTECVVR